MATDPSFVDHLLDILAGAGDVSARKMFGEYGLYLDGKMVGLICDNRFLIKAPESASDLVAGLDFELPYPSAKRAYPVVTEDRWHDQDWLIQLLRVTHEAMPVRKAKRKR